MQKLTWVLHCRSLQLLTGPTGAAVTPACGACAPGVASGNASQFNASLSGLGCAWLQLYLSSTQSCQLQFSHYCCMRAAAGTHISVHACAKPRSYIAR